MKKHIILSFSLFFLFILLMGTSGETADLPQSDRDQIINQEMDCVSSHLRAKESMGWVDVCSTSDKSDVYTFDDNDRVKKKHWFSIHPALTRDNPLTHVEIGGESFFYSYREPDLMKTKGYKNGIFGSFTYRLKENERPQSLKEIFSGSSGVNMLRVEGRYAFGKTDYESNGTGSEDGIPYWAIECRGLAGYDIPLTSAVRLTPYVGLGYRYLYDDGGGGVTTTGHWGYDRESQYVYLPLGLETEYKFKNSWSIGLTVEYDYFIDGEQTSHLEDGGTGYDPLENDQNDGYGLRGSFRVMKESQAMDFFVEPFVRYWDIEDSKVSALTINGQVIPVPGSPGYVYGGREPKNNTTEYGVKLGLRY